MSPRIRFEDVGEQPLSGVVFDSENSKFLVRAGFNGEFVCNLPYNFQGFDNSKVADGLIELFSHPTHSESDVRPVKLDQSDNTVGWLCTISALTSTQHDFVDSPYFRLAAFVAVNLLLAGGRYTNTPMLNHEAEVAISDFFDEELSILILHKPSVTPKVGPGYTELLPNLHQYGFIPVGAQTPFPGKVGNIANDKFAQSGKTIRLLPVSNDVKFEDFTNQVFRQLYPSATTPLLRFFIYYQLIETLLARIFNDRQSKIIMEMLPVIDNPVKVHPLIKKLQEDAAEKRRMNLLFHNYSNVATDMSDLLVASNDFLKRCGAEEHKNAAEALYEVRNLVFHDLRDIPVAAMSCLEDVVEQLSYAVPELLIRFRIPVEA